MYDTYLLTYLLTYILDADAEVTAQWYRVVWMTAAVNLRVISVLMHIETMLLYQAHYVGCVKHQQSRTEYAALLHAEQSSRRRRLYATMWHVLLALIQIWMITDGKTQVDATSTDAG